MNRQKVLWGVAGISGSYIPPVEWVRLQCWNGLSLWEYFLLNLFYLYARNTLLSQEHKEAKVLILEEEGLRTQSKRNRNNTISLKQ